MRTIGDLLRESPRQRPNNIGSRQRTARSDTNQKVSATDAIALAGAGRYWHKADILYRPRRAGSARLAQEAEASRLINLVELRHTV